MSTRRLERGLDSSASALSAGSKEAQGGALSTVRSARWETILPLVMALSGCAQNLTGISPDSDSDDCTGISPGSECVDTGDTDSQEGVSPDPETLKYVIAEINTNYGEVQCLEDAPNGDDCLIWYAGNDASVYEIATDDLGIAYQDIKGAMVYWSESTAENVQGINCGPSYSLLDERYHCVGYSVDGMKIDDITQVISAGTNPETGESAPEGNNPGAAVIITHSGQQNW